MPFSFFSSRLHEELHRKRTQVIVSETLVDMLQDYEDVGTCQKYQFLEKKVTGGQLERRAWTILGLFARPLSCPAWHDGDYAWSPILPNHNK